MWTIYCFDGIRLRQSKHVSGVVLNLWLPLEQKEEPDRLKTERGIFFPPMPARRSKPRKDPHSVAASVFATGFLSS